MKPKEIVTEKWVRDTIASFDDGTLLSEAPTLKGRDYQVIIRTIEPFSIVDDEGELWPDEAVHQAIVNVKNWTPGAPHPHATCRFSWGESTEFPSAEIAEDAMRLQLLQAVRDLQQLAIDHREAPAA